MMAMAKNLVPGSTQMLVLRLLAERDMYGYEMIETLRTRSNDTFDLKAGTLYPILHGLEQEGKIESYEQTAEQGAGKPRRYYHITKAGRATLEGQTAEWRRVSAAINAVLKAAIPAGVQPKEVR
jgi:PadR family transcriptional regulator PadR